MSEQEEIQQAEAPVQGQENQQSLFQEGGADNRNAVERASSFLSGLKGSSEAINEMNQELNPPQEEEKTEEGPKTEAKILEEAQNKKPESNQENTQQEDQKEEEQQPEDQQQQDDKEVESPLFGGKKKVSDIGKKEELDLSDIDKVNSYVKNKFGVDALDKFISSADKWRKDSQTLSQESKKIKAYEQVFQTMPDELLQAVTDFTEGKDWKDPILSRPHLNFAKGVEEYNTKQLIDAFYPDKFSEDEWEAFKEGNDESITKAVNVVLEQAKEKYTQAKGSFESERARRQEDANRVNTLKQESVSGSVSFLKESLPDVSDSYVQSIQEDMLSGDLNKIFFNEDGTYAKDAALKAALARDGFELIKQLITINTHKAQTEERQEILSRGADKPQARRAGLPKVNVDKVENEVNRIFGALGQKAHTY